MFVFLQMSSLLTLLLFLLLYYCIVRNCMFLQIFVLLSYVRLTCMNKRLLLLLLLLYYYYSTTTTTTATTLLLLLLLLYSYLPWIDLERQNKKKILVSPSFSIYRQSNKEMKLIRCACTGISFRVRKIHLLCLVKRGCPFLANVTQKTFHYLRSLFLSFINEQARGICVVRCGHVMKAQRPLLGTISSSSKPQLIIFGIAILLVQPTVALPTIRYDTIPVSL